MTKKEQALFKVKIDKMSARYGKAAKSNPKFRETFIEFLDISVGVDNLCNALNMVEQAAIEREESMYKWFNEAKKFEERVLQLEEDKKALLTRIAELEKEHEV